MEDERNRIVNIQLLRAVAALVVVFGHAEVSTYYLASYMGDPFERTGFVGAWGVDLFFVISGFIMVHASAGLYGRPGARSLFLKRRIFRIVPLYWLATLTLAAWEWRVHALPDPALLASSLAFLPYDAANEVRRVVPLIQAGWTLNFEMLFYLLFALFLSRTAALTVVRTGAVLLGLVLLGPLAAQWGVAPFTWTRPIVLEFLAGMILGLIHRRGVSLPAAARLLLLALAAAIALAKPERAFDHWQSMERVLFWGVPAALLLGAVVLGPLKLPGARLWSPLGDASYSIYLWHMPMLTLFFFLWRHFRWPFDAAGFLLFFVACAVVAGLLSHYLFERPVTRWLNRRFAARGGQEEPGPAASAAA